MGGFRFLGVIGATALAAFPVALEAQTGNIVVTGSRRDFQFYDDEQAAIGLKIKADYFAQKIYVSSDSRDAALRASELSAMLRQAIAMAGDHGIELVSGAFELNAVTLQNMDELRATGGPRPDTSRVTIYAQIPVNDDVATGAQAAARIKAFVDAVPVTGRSFIETGGVDLTIMNPDQYRIDVVREVATQSTHYAAMFGNDYGVEIRGLDAELSWTQVSESEVLLYIPHNFVIRPK